MGEGIVLLTDDKDELLAVAQVEVVDEAIEAELELESEGGTRHVRL